MEVLKNRLDKCPSDMTGTGGLALRWRDGKDVPLGAIPVLQPGEISNTIGTISCMLTICKDILNNIFKLLKKIVKTVALLEKKLHTLLLVMVY